MQPTEVYFRNKKKREKKKMTIKQETAIKKEMDQTDRGWLGARLKIEIKTF